MLGLDGLSEEFLRAPFVHSSMPNLTSALDASARGRLASTIPPYTGPAWTTITTGVDPGRHGVFGFTDRDGRPVSASRVRIPRVWDYIGSADGRSIVINVPLTFPARPIAGLMAAGMPAPPTGGWTYPDDFADRLHDLADGYVIDEAVIGNPRLDSAATRLADMTEKRGRAVAALAAEESWDLLAVVFVLPDRLGHPWWKHLVPGSPLYETSAAERSRTALQRSLIHLDNAIGDLLAALPSGTTTVICSDHGFGALTADVFFDVVLAKAGLIEGARGKVVRRVARRAASSPIGRAIPRSIIERTKRSLSRTTERAAWTAPKYEGAIRVADASQGVEEEVRDLLRGLRAPDGSPLVRQVLGRTDVYNGEYVKDAAELFPEFVREDVELHEGLTGDQWWVSRENEGWGTHRRDGVIAIHGEPRLGDAVHGNVADVTPTLLAALGLEAPDLDGASLLPARDLTKVTARRPDDDSGAYDENEEAAVMEHLRGLGYVE